MGHPAFNDYCRCEMRRYRVPWSWSSRNSAYALLCATCDWGITSLGEPAPKPTWWYRILGGDK